MSSTDFQNKLKLISTGIVTIFGIILMLGLLLLLLQQGIITLHSENGDEEVVYDFDIDHVAPYDDYFDVALLNDSPENDEIKYGYELFKNTPDYIGPDNGNPDMVYSGNNLSCNNCHLYAGTKKYAGALIGIIQRFPQYRGREDKIGTIEERIHGCMERSMNGKPMPDDSKEMKAIISYMEWLGRDAPEDGTYEGSGFVTIEIPNRAVDLDNGAKVFNNYCVICHQANGQGKKYEGSNVYQYPPLWGDDSFNNGAGMNRVITAANFIKGNMPYGTTYDSPLLTDEQAYDVAGYINQQKRPTKPNLEVDFPDLKRKPVSTPYPPYADHFTIEQHQLGPFQPIMEYYKTTYNIIKKK